MAQIYQNQPTISHITKLVDISRQGTHKLIRRLEAKGLVEIVNSNNKKDKCIRLTALGDACYEQYESLKLSIENKIAEIIGAEQLDCLHNILKTDWGL